MPSFLELNRKHGAIASVIQLQAPEQCRLHCQRYHDGNAQDHVFLDLLAFMSSGSYAQAKYVTAFQWQ